MCGAVIEQSPWVFEVFVLISKEFLSSPCTEAQRNRLLALIILGTLLTDRDTGDPRTPRACLRGPISAVFHHPSVLDWHQICKLKGYILRFWNVLRTVPSQFFSIWGIGTILLNKSLSLPHFVVKYSALIIYILCTHSCLPHVNIDGVDWSTWFMYRSERQSAGKKKENRGQQKNAKHILWHKITKIF